MGSATSRLWTDFLSCSPFSPTESDQDFQGPRAPCPSPKDCGRGSEGAWSAAPAGSLRVLESTAEGLLAAVVPACLPGRPRDGQTSPRGVGRLAPRFARNDSVTAGSPGALRVRVPRPLGPGLLCAAPRVSSPGRPWRTGRRRSRVPRGPERLPSQPGQKTRVRTAYGSSGLLPASSMALACPGSAAVWTQGSWRREQARRDRARVGAFPLDGASLQNRVSNFPSSSLNQAWPSKGPQGEASRPSSVGHFRRLRASAVVGAAGGGLRSCHYS